jgi:hypothetical protein
VKILLKRFLWALLCLAVYVFYQTTPDVLTDEERRYLSEHQKTTNKQPPFAFTTDHCSLVPDLGVRHACFVHDVAYHHGGTTIERYWADVNLYDEVYDRYGLFAAEVYFFAVRVGGDNSVVSSIWPWRWGYGYPVGDARANQ